MHTKDPNRYESFLSVFVHEVFHAVHRFYLDENGCCENLSEYYHAVVLESLATYFQINYLRYRGFSEKAEEIEENVFRHSPIFYPKSGCKERFNYNRVFNEALDWTKDDFEQALRKLVNKYDADIIMQKENYIIYDEVILKNKKKTDVSLPDERQAKENISENSNNKKNDSNRIGSALDILKSVFYGEWECDSDKTGDDCIFVNGKKIHLYIAGQTLNYRIESQRGHLYAPQKGYPTMLDVNPGDIIFSYRNGQIVSINVALAAENTYGTEDGLRIECIYSELTTPLDIKYIRQNIAGLKPFYGHGCLPRRGYIHHLSSSAARIMMKEIKKLGNRPR